MLVGLSRAWSQWHIDAAGLCTMVYMKSSIKIWVIAHDEDIQPATYKIERRTLNRDKVDILLLREGALL